MKSETVSGLGTLLASILPVSCCIGPAIFVLFGTTAGTLGHLSFREPFRAYLLVAAFLLFAFSFWKRYLKPRDCNCKEDFRARNITRGFFGVGAAALVSSVSFQTVLLYMYQ
jgi:mercuric ion transport protein